MTKTRLRILHVANWFPNPWDTVEGNFVQDQVRVFDQVAISRVVHVQVRYQARRLLALRRIHNDESSARGYYILTRIRAGKIIEWLTTLLLMFVMVQERAWRYDALHVHIAYPLLSKAWLLKLFWKKPILISEHWTAYHFNFNLPEENSGLRNIRAAFCHGFPVIAVSKALLDDIRRFSGGAYFQGYVIPNVVPLHGYRATLNSRPTLFVVNVWRDIKDPMPMLYGLSEASAQGANFNLVIGGYGALIDQMKTFVETSALARCTRFLGKMTKREIAAQLAISDGYIFSSRYETFSVACAEALGAGVPLIGPYVPAIAEYASPENWEVVEARDTDAWRSAGLRFLEKLAAGKFDSEKIARDVVTRFDHGKIKNAYSLILQKEVSR